MGRQRHSCCQKLKLRKGLWSPEEDAKLFNHITSFGVGCWSSVPKLAGLQRCGKSCRLRWINYLRPDLKRGMFSQEEEDLILSLHKILGNRWAQIAARMPGRTDNEIKNFWNSSLKKKLVKQGIDPATHGPLPAVKREETNKDNIPFESNDGSAPPFLVTDNVYYESKHFATEQPVLDPLHSFACNPIVADPDGRSKMMGSGQGRPNFVSIEQPRLLSAMPGLVDSDYHSRAEFCDDRLDSRMSWSLFDTNEEMKLEEAEGSAWEDGQLLSVDYGLPSFTSPGEDDDDLLGVEF